MDVGRSLTNDKSSDNPYLFPTSTMNQILADAETQRRARKPGSTTMVLKPPPPAAVIPSTKTSLSAPAKKGRKIKASMLAGAHGVHFTGGSYMNVGGDLVRNGAKVDGVKFYDAMKGSEGDEIEVDYLENSSKLTMEGSAEHVNVGGAVRYIPAGQDGVATKSSRVQKADVHAHMFTKLRDSKFTGGQYTNVAGNIDYVGTFESAPPAKGKKDSARHERSRT